MNSLLLLANTAVYGAGGAFFTLILLAVIIVIERYILQKRIRPRYANEQKKILFVVVLANILSTYPGGIVAAALDWELTWKWDLTRVKIFALFFSVTLLIESPITIIFLRKLASVKALFQATFFGNIITYFLLFVWLTHWFSVDRPSKRMATMFTMRSLGCALGSYQVDYGIFPKQKILGNAQNAALPKFYYAGRYIDSWRTPIQYVSDGISYTLMSYGADRKSGGEEFDADFMFSNGKTLWVVPEGDYRQETSVDNNEFKE